MYPLNRKIKMSDEDRLNYLHNELEQLIIKQKRFAKDTVRNAEDIAFYQKCNSYFISQIKQEIQQLQHRTK
tara:strand:- start:367 stop:579 length:213 start_codon:yes stop_codon:yes gene_type:complete